MNKFYVPEISLRDIRNNIGILSKFEEKYNKSISRYSVILSNNGYYKYDKDKLTKYKFIERESNITENFFKNYTLIEHISEKARFRFAKLDLVHFSTIAKPQKNQNIVFYTNSTRFREKIKMD